MNNNTEQVFIINHSQEFETKDESELGTGQINLENIEDFTNVCRTCAAVTEFVVPIFIGEGLQNKLADKIHKYLPIQVSEEDVLPQVVCYQCVSTLISWHDLVQNCTQADTALNNKLSELLQDSTSKIHDRIYEIRTKGKLKDSFRESDGCKDFDKRKICEYCGIRQTEEDYPEHVISMHSEDLLPFRERDPFLYVISDDDDQYEDDNPTRKFKQIKTLENLKTAEPAVKTKVPDAGQINKKPGSAKNPPTEKKKRQTNDKTSAPKPILHIKAATKEKLTRNPRSEVCKERKSNVSMASKNSRNKQKGKKLAPAAVSADLDAPLEINGPSKQIDNVEIIMACVDKLNAKKKVKPLRCKYCPRVFTARSSFEYHVKNSHFIKETECEKCHKKFRNKQVLSQHISHIHEGHKKTYICKYCHKSFCTAANLYCHEQTHLDTKKWPCTKCKSSFRWRTHLLRHMKRHSEEPNLGCHLCDRRFNVLDDLRRHEFTHTEDKQECYRCGKQFSQLRYLRVHMAKKHNETIAGN
ncbi:PREDICTED: zinc finger protein 37 homolog isoform X1 [Papilio polytes]|uniref:zinc finger protein 37 homolog isoform X1 n=1 Tax=Papilio polytes TaxID=76194 RepID=UPI0006766877|nr:PREDICTED: zinc finger protein 37 homolog isoform X1 [Papilio polytes]